MKQTGYVISYMNVVIAVLTISTIYIIDVLANDIPDISQVEYFIDNDPGEGNGFALFPVDGQMDSPLEQMKLDNVGIENLSSGSHSIYVRAKNTNDKWGRTRSYPFVISESSQSDSKVFTLSAAEYYFDHDPGTGNGFPLSPLDGVFDSAEEQLEMHGIDISNLSEGNHRLFVRGMRNDNVWGHTKSFELIIDRTPPIILLNKSIHEKKIRWSWSAEDDTSVQFRYSIDENPLWENPSGNFLRQFTVIESKVGHWYLHIQAKDSAGNLSEIVNSEAIIKSNMFIKNVIMLAGGKASIHNMYWDITKKITINAYNNFKHLNFDDENIYYMINSHIIDINNDDIADNVVDSYSPTVESFLYAIENRYVSELTTDDALLIYMFGHGTKDIRFQVLGVDNMLSASDLDTALDFLQHQTNCKVVLIIESCYSGNFIEDLKNPSRVILTSVSNEPYSIDASGFLSFSRLLFSKLREGDSLEKSYAYTKHNMASIGYPLPQLSGSFASFVYLGDIVMEPKAEIQNVVMNQTLPENSQSVWITVQAIAGANAISSVFAQIIPPQAFIQNNQETILYPTISLTYHQELNQYKGLLNDLYKPGIYKIVIFAQDTQKILSNAVIYSVNAPGIYRPGDLNYDRQTNVDDVIIALKIVSNIQSEIKIDQKIGLVEVIDLLKKAGTF
jgi:hypothetical protein